MAKIKGVSMEGLIEALSERADEARERLPEELHSYLEEQIVVSRWYPEEHHHAMLCVLGALLEADGVKDVYDTMGVMHMREQARGIYQHLLSGLDVKAPASRIAALWGSMHDSGRIEVETMGPTHVQVMILDYGHPTTEMCAMVGAYFRETYRLSGAVEPRVSETNCCVRGDDVCRWDIRWSETTAAT